MAGKGNVFKTDKTWKKRPKRSLPESGGRGGWVEKNEGKYSQ